MALNFKLHVNKACFESLCTSTMYLLESSKTVEICLKTMFFLCTCHYLSHFSADFGGLYLNYVSIQLWRWSIILWDFFKSSSDLKHFDETIAICEFDEATRMSLFPWHKAVTCTSLFNLEKNAFLRVQRWLETTQQEENEGRRDLKRVEFRLN
ncbi:hypothetical protein P5673_001424 [Acropora cervicornis]|uniref:Uncharacterized protein n=1 Tax=Acropora cervicornis TaxID=6130 RepID=A0AAD9VGL2_ACRCE|nr:hypothetical protein P5673_001424 [Acropora cervicornis]